MGPHTWNGGLMEGWNSWATGPEGVVWRYAFIGRFKIKRDKPGQTGTNRDGERVGLRGDLKGEWDEWDLGAGWRLIGIGKLCFHILFRIFIFWFLV